MEFRKQDLNEDKRYWTHARAWLRPSGDWWKKRTLAICWSMPCSHCGWEVSFGDGDEGRDLGFTFAIPFLLSVWITFERLFPRRLFTWDMDRGDDRVGEMPH